MGDSLVMVSQAGVREQSTATLYVYVDDVDAAHARAEAFGARTIEPPQDLHYGDRRAVVVDSTGNTWQIATRLSPSPS